jgi:tetratricopeptide (TPR) repeat protein
LEDIEKTPNTTPNPMLQYRKASILFDMKEYEKAKNVLESLVKIRQLTPSHFQETSTDHTMERENRIGRIRPTSSDSMHSRARSTTSTSRFGSIHTHMNHSANTHHSAMHVDTVRGNKMEDTNTEKSSLQLQIASNPDSQVAFLLGKTYLKLNQKEKALFIFVYCDREFEPKIRSLIENEDND